MTKAKSSKPVTAVDVLRNLREDIRKMDWERLSYDGRRVLIAKTKVLELVKKHWLKQNVHR